MKVLSRFVAVAGLILASGAINAQTLTIAGPGSSVIVGNNFDVTVTLDMNGVASSGLGFNIEFDETELTFVGVVCEPAAGMTTCTDLAGGDGAINFGKLGAATDGLQATLTFSTTGTTPGTYNIGAPNTATYTDPGFNSQPLTVVDDNVTVSLGPMPTATVAPASVDLGSLVQGFGPVATDTITITNTGDPATTLTGTCTLTNIMPAASTGITISPATVNLSLAQNASTSVTVTGDNTQPVAMYSADFACTGTNSAGGDPAVVPITFEVRAPADAQFSSAPAPGAVDVTAMTQPLESSGDTVTQDIVISNLGSPGDRDLTAISCALTTGAEFSITGTPGATVAPGGSTTVSVTFDSTTATFAGNPYMDTLTCDYQEDGATTQQAVYMLSANVRQAGSSVAVPTATSLTILVDGFNGTGSVNVVFREVLGEGVDGSVTCSLGGADAGLFSITSPAVFPAPVPSGGTLLVSVQGTEPGGTPVVATLDCTANDTVNGATVFSAPLGFVVQPAVVPTLSQWAMIIMALVLAGFGFSRIRRESPLA